MQCPIETTDALANLKNRNWAFANVGYGPANPEMPNDEFWQAKSKTWNTDLEQAMSMRCGNCAAFIQTPEMIECITDGMHGEDGEESDEESEDDYEGDAENAAMEGEENEEGDDEGMDVDLEGAVQEAANLGYCELFHFKCAAARTCDAWLVGGPITRTQDSRRSMQAMRFYRSNFPQQG